MDCDDPARQVAEGCPGKTGRRDHALQRLLRRKGADAFGKVAVALGIAGDAADWIVCPSADRESLRVAIVSRGAFRTSFPALPAKRRGAVARCQIASANNAGPPGCGWGYQR